MRVVPRPGTAARREDDSVGDLDPRLDTAGRQTCIQLRIQGSKEARSSTPRSTRRAEDHCGLDVRNSMD